jgi:hypothetical protein
VTRARKQKDAKICGSKARGGTENVSRSINRQLNSLNFGIFVAKSDRLIDQGRTFHQMWSVLFPSSRNCGTEILSSDSESSQKELFNGI